MKTWSILAGLLLLAPLAHGQEEAGLRTELRGYLRGRLGLLPSIAGDDWNGLLRARPELLVSVSERLSATLTLSAERYLGRSEELLGAQGELRVDRAFVDYQMGKVDLRAGRQAINFGRALIWNPVDLVDANTALDFQVEKRGVDALRAAVAVGPTASVLGLMAFPEAGLGGRAGRPVIALARGEVLLGDTELGLIAAHDGRAEDWVLGLDAKGDLELGWWIEAAAHWPAEAEAWHDVVLGVDYSFAVLQRLYVAAQVRRDSSGGTGVDDYDFLALARGRSFLGRHYASAVATLSASELSSGTGSVILNLEDGSYVATLGLTRHFFENLEVTARASLLRGSGPGEFNPIGEHPLAGRLPRETYELWMEWRF